VARAVLGAGEAPEVGRVRALALALSRLLKRELVYRPGAKFEQVFAETLTDLQAAGWLIDDGERIAITAEGRDALPVFAGQIASYLESYRLVVNQALATPGASARDLAQRMVLAGERALLLGDLQRREAISRPLFDSALEYLQEEGVLGDKGKLRDVAQAL
jgi:glycerol-3-phosphate O-acyltransferase